MVETGAVQVQQTRSSSASEERRRTGQYIALGVVLATSLVGLYHACLQHNAALAGFLVPAVIMMLYLVWVLHSTRAKHKQQQQHEASVSGMEAGMSPAAAKRLADHSPPQSAPADSQGKRPHNNINNNNNCKDPTPMSTS